MNIVEAARKMRNGQIAVSKEAQERVQMVDDYFLHYVDHTGTLGRRVVFNPQEWLADDWEIEIEWVDFWTAWQARVNKGKKIRSEHWHETVHFDSFFPTGERRIGDIEINGKWQIID